MNIIIKSLTRSNIFEMLVDPISKMQDDEGIKGKK